MLKARSIKAILTRRIIIVLVLALLLFLLSLLSNHPHWIERYYSQGLYPVICRVLHPVLNVFPFSVGDVVYLFVIGYLVYALVRLIRMLWRKQFAQTTILLSGLIIGLQVAVLIFYLFWGLNYFRPSAGERLNLRDTNYTTVHLKQVTSILIDSANTCRARITKADTQQNNSAIYQTAVKAVLKLSSDSADFRTYSPRVKSSLLTPILNYIGTSGYYNPFTTESQLNYQMPYFERPVVACHEMSHQMGYGAEDEADFAGFLAGVGSQDRLLRYSAYQLAVEQCMRALRYRDTTANNELKPQISALVRNDFKQQRLYWLKYQSRIDVISGIFYDHFLKVNNQPHGLQTYNQMVLLLMAWYK
jgi:peroxiredoxin family protein